MHSTEVDPKAWCKIFIQHENALNGSRKRTSTLQEHLDPARTGIDQIDIVEMENTVRHTFGNHP